LLGIEPELAQRAAGAAVGILERGEQQVVDADVAVAALGRLPQGQLEHGARVGGDPARPRVRARGRDGRRRRRALDERRARAAARVGERDAARLEHHGRARRPAADDAQQQVLAANRGSAHRRRLLARERDRGARLAGHDEPVARLRLGLAVGKLDPGEIPVAAVRGLAGDADRARHVAERLAGVERAGDLQALEGVQLLAQRGHRAQRRRGLARAHRVLDELAQAI
jgi:hypothetical protein